MKLKFKQQKGAPRPRTDDTRHEESECQGPSINLPVAEWNHCLRPPTPCCPFWAPGSEGATWPLQRPRSWLSRQAPKGDWRGYFFTISKRCSLKTRGSRAFKTPPPLTGGRLQSNTQLFAQLLNCLLAVKCYGLYCQETHPLCLPTALGPVPRPSHQNTGSLGP